MNFPPIPRFFAFLILLHHWLAAKGNGDVSFDQNYKVSWGFDHFMTLNQGKEVQLSMDISSGSGFESKLNYGSGFFQMMIKVPNRDSAGVVTAFYLTSKTSMHDELDFEFLGNREGKPITLQTNVFVKGIGNREQRMHLWFDPTTAFHTYKLLWNPHQIVFYVDNTPIRVVKNIAKIGVSYPSQPMQIETSLWDGDDWATDGGQTKTNWSYSPFQAQFQSFNINGCPIQSSVQQCYSSQYWWNTKKYWKLSSAQQVEYENVRKKYMNYDYCTDRSKHPIPPIECSYQ